MAESHTQGGSHEQHVKAGEQSHKNTPSTHGTQEKHDAKSSTTQGTKSSHESGTQGGTHEQHVKAGQQSHRNS